MLQQNIFSDRNFKHKLEHFNIDDIPELQNKIETISKYIKSLESGRIEKTKEESIQADFLNKFFGDILGFEYSDSNMWYLEKEYKSITDGTKADGALGFFKMDGRNIASDVRVVIELKDALTDLDKPQNRQGDKRTPVEQAFSYSSKAGGRCKWVIVSNFKEIRLYHSSDQSYYENFVLLDLLKPDTLKRFFFLLYKNHLINQTSESFVDVLYRERQDREQTNLKLFYNQYKNLRIELFDHLKINNPEIDEIVLLAKSQKILDRFIFICFCEDKNLLPSYTLKKIKDILNNAFDFEPNKLWRQLKGLFYSIDIGNPPLDINKFNGGLFKKDEDLDNLILKDDILLKLIALSEFDFDSDLNVNILGHIFEQSLSDIETLKTQINFGKILSDDEKNNVRKNGKRKKDGIFYTPEYITRYIVKEAIGGWLEDRKQDLGFNTLPELTSEDIASIKQDNKKSSKLKYNKNVESWITFWEAYKEQLMHIKILDPACGSGAFLNQAFDFLFAEGQKVNNELSRLRLGQRELFDLDKHILTNNIFGVDLNPESVEITKLSLWLKTANRGKELTSIDENIKCGNSLIDEPSIAGDKAFNWFDNFSSVFPNYRKPQINEMTPNVIEKTIYNYRNPDHKGLDKNGFDVILGNPPYVVLSSFNNKEFGYLQDKYKTSFGRLNTFALFIERISQIMNKQGKSGLIIPDSLCMIDYYTNLREFLLNNYNIEQIIELGDGIFEDATVPAIIFIFGSQTVNNQIKVGTKNCLIDTSNFKVISQNIYSTTAKFSFNLHIDNVFLKLRSLIDNKCYFSLKDVIEIKIGVCTGNNQKQMADSPIFPNSKRVLQGKNVNRYLITYDDKYLNYDRKELLRAREEQLFLMSEKLLMRQTSDKLIIAYDNNQYYAIDSLFVLFPKINTLNIKYILALLNSKLLNYQYQKLNPELGRVFAQVKIDYVNELPIKVISPNDQNVFTELSDKIIHNNNLLFKHKLSFIELLKTEWANITITGKLYEWNNLSFEDFRKELEKQKINLTLEQRAEWLKYFNEQKQKTEVFTKAINQTDKEIDLMVYKLYELTEDEIKIVETVSIN